MGEIAGKNIEQLDRLVALELLNSLEKALFTRRPVLAELISVHGNKTLAEYADSFLEGEATPIDRREDVEEAACSYAERLLGPECAEKLRKRISAHPSLLTANHHGPEFSGITLPGDILFALAEGKGGIVPIFAFGAVPLNNLTYPRGIEVSDDYKLNIFPDRLKTCLVSSAPPFTEKMVDEAEKKLALAMKKGELTEKAGKVVENILMECYKDKKVLACSSFSDQSVLLNREIWRKYFSPEITQEMPELAYLEIEQIVSAVLDKDLQSQESFMRSILFDDKLRDLIFGLLDTKASCWDKERLKALGNEDLSGDQRRTMMQNAGTAFFWGIDEKGRRVPLYLENSPENGGLKLRGVDDSGNRCEYSFTPDSVRELLKARRIIPNLFTCFSTIAFARGYKCYGGFMQTDYLTNMKNGVVSALTSCGKKEWAEKVQTVPTVNYSTGIRYMVRKTGEGLVSVGGIDLITFGGLTEEHIKKMSGDISLNDAFKLGLLDMYKVVYRPEERGPQYEPLNIDVVYKTGKPLIELNT